MNAVVEADRTIRPLRIALEACRGLALDDPIRIDRLNDLAYATRLDDSEGSLRLSREAEKLAESRGYLAGLGWALRNQTFRGFMDLDFSGIQTLAERAKEIFEALDDRRGMAAALDRLATLHEQLGEYSVALKHALKALELAQELEDETRTAWALSSLAGVYAAIGEEASALEYCRKALEIFECIPDAVGVFRVSWRLTRLHRQYSRPDEAYEVSRRTWEMAQETDDILPRSITEIDLGLSFEALSRFDEAVRCLEFGLERLPVDYQGSVGVEARVGLARIHLRRNDLDAVESVLRSFTGTELTNAGSGGLEAREIMARVAEQRGDHASALEHLRRANQQRERIAERNSRRNIARLEFQMELEAAKKDAEIHRLKYVELERMQSQLVEAERYAVVGDLAAGIAHELNSPLGVVRSNLQLLERLWSRLEERVPGGLSTKEARARQVALDANGQALDRIGELAQSLSRFAVLDGAEYQRIDLGEVLNNILTLFSAQTPEGIHVVRCVGDLPEVWGHPGELNQAFMAVLRTAEQGAKPVGTIRIETRAHDAIAEIRISDDGRAIAPHELRRLFEPGFDERERKVRFRFGLAAAANAMRRHGGRIEVASESDRGTCFTLTLPVGFRPEPSRGSW